MIDLSQTIQYMGPATEVDGDWYVSPNGILCKPDGEKNGRVRIVAAYHPGEDLVPKDIFETEYRLFQFGERQ